MQATSESGRMEHEIYMPTKTNDMKILRDDQLRSCSVPRHFMIYRIVELNTKYRTKDE